MDQRQVHIWMSESEYHLLREIAQDRQETVSSFLRRLIRVYRLLHTEGHRRPASRAAAVEAGPQVFG